MTTGAQCECKQCELTRQSLHAMNVWLNVHPHLKESVAAVVRGYKRSLAAHQRSSDKEAAYVRFTEDKRGTSPYYKRHKLYDSE